MKIKKRLTAFVAMFFLMAFAVGPALADNELIQADNELIQADNELIRAGPSSTRCKRSDLRQLLATAPAAQPGAPRPSITPLNANLRTDCPEVLRTYWQNTGVTSLEPDTGQPIQHPGSVGWTETRFTGGNATIQVGTPIQKGRRICVEATQVTPDFQAEPKTYRLDWQPSYTLPQSCIDARDQWYIDIENHEAVHYQDAKNLADAANTIWQASPPRLKYCAPTLNDAMSGLQAEFQAAVLNYGECLAAAFNKRVDDFHKTPAGAAALPSPNPSLCECPSCEQCCHGECLPVDCGECYTCENNSCVPDQFCLDSCSSWERCDLACPPLFGSSHLSVGQLATRVVCACSPCCPGCHDEACGLPFTLEQSDPEVVGMSFDPEGPFVGELYVPVEVVDGVPQIPTVYRKALSSGTSKETMSFYGWCWHIYTWTVQCQ